MSYGTIADMAGDADLLRRVASAAAKERKGVNPIAWAQANLWHLSAEPGWDEAYAYALNAGNQAPGRDEGVITDSMILSAVQSRMSWQDDCGCQ